MVGEIVIDGVRMEDGDKSILAGLDTLDQRKDFMLVYLYMHKIRGCGESRIYEEVYANTNTNDNLEQVKEGEFIENDHSELVGERRLDVDSIERVKSVAKIIEDVIVEDEKRVKSAADGEGKRKMRICRDRKPRLACEDEGCKQTFTYRGNLKRHMKQKISVKCGLCNAEFRGGNKVINSHEKDS